MREVVLGTAGHVDHGKTSLVKALTGIDTDRLKEEKERGITIELGFAFLDLPCGHRLGIIDVPGHERFVRNMVAGATGIDLVAFVIAADEGIMPQTREHFEICRLLGVKKGLVIVTKKDMVEPDWLTMVQEEILEFLAGSFLDGAPLIPVSSITGEGIEAVRDAMDRLVRESEFAEAHGPFRLPIDRIFTMKGFGSVVTGTSISGRIATGADVVVYPQELAAKIRGIQVHGKEVSEVEAGKRTAINIQGLDKETINRGDVLATPGTLKPSYMLDADFLYLTANKKPLKNRARVRVHLGTAEVFGRLILLADQEITPGASADVQLHLEEPVAVWPGDRFVVRSYSPVFTIGGGEILNAVPPRRRRFRAENQAVFTTYRHAGPEERLLLLLKESGYAGLTLAELSVRAGLFGKRISKILGGPISAGRIKVIESDSQRMLFSEIYDSLPARFQAILSRFHQENPIKPGLAREEIRALLPHGVDPRLFQYLMNDLLRKGVIAQDEAVIRLASHQLALKTDTLALKTEMLAIFANAGLTPPLIKDVLASFAAHPPQVVRQILDLLLREKTVMKISEELYFHAEVLAALQEKLVSRISRDNGIDAQGFKELTGLTRKFTIPLLEYFDRIKLTIRVGDKRLLREQRG